MRPIRLEMEGFTSFRDRTVIDFSNLQLFAITGPTGAGKTSIIDAITYVLYGCTSRIGEKQIRELISQGMPRVTVLFEFSSSVKKYRISRTSKWTGKSLTTEVRFGECIGEDWLMIADSVKETKASIERVIGLDFDGFTKSVVLPQGKFDEFLKGKPEERRKILSDLLNLDVYTRMMKRANAIARENQNQASYIETQLERDFADATPENIAAQESLLDDLNPKIASMDADLDKLKQLIPLAHALQQDRLELVKAEEEIKNFKTKEADAQRKSSLIQSRIDEIQKSVSTLDRRIESNPYDPQLHLKLASDLQAVQSVLKVLDEIQDLERTLADKKVLLQNHLDQTQILSKRHHDAEKELNTAAKELQESGEQLRMLQQSYRSPDAIQAEIENLKELERQHKKLAKGKTELKKQEDAIKKSEKELDSLEKKFSIAENRLTEKKLALQELERRHAAQTLRASLVTGESCPVCDQEISSLPAITRHASLDKAKNELQQAEQEMDSLAERRTQLRIEVKTSRNNLEQFQKGMEEVTEIVNSLKLRYEAYAADALKDDSETQMSKIKNQFEEWIKVNSTRMQSHEKKKEAESRIASQWKDSRHQHELLEKEITGHQTRLEQLRQQAGKPIDMKSLQRKVDAQEKARLERGELVQEREQFLKKLSAAKDELLPAQSEYHSFTVARNTRLERIEQLKLRMEENASKLKPHESLERFETSIRNLELDRGKLHSDSIRIQERLQVLQSKWMRASELREKLEMHQAKFHNANELGQLLHGDNFIAFIQQEAYRRLATDGSIHLRTLSAERYSFTVQGEDFHVIDHWNADESRPVSTLSGGESFLASLALALALAEGLSGMSSGPIRFALESLFLDEGFGTLDPETLETVVSGIEALSIQDRLIGIISHLPNLAERMLTRIVVHKFMGGSRVEIQ